MGAYFGTGIVMRNLAIRLVLWLCARYEISVLDEARRDMGNDVAARSQRWESFAREQGGLYDLITQQRHNLFAEYSNTLPSEREIKDNLAMQDRCWQQLKARVDGVIQEGRIKASNERQNAATISPIRKSV